MASTATPAPASDRELVLTRIVNAPREKLLRAWTEPQLLKQWFAPLPFTTPVAELDVRPGGANLIVMRGPDGNDIPNRGVYLEVVRNKRLVLTDAYTRAWEPSAKPFMTVILTFENECRGTTYTARVAHWIVADREVHEKMGFHQGWGSVPTNLRPSSRSSDEKGSAWLERPESIDAGARGAASVGPQMDYCSVRAGHIARSASGRAIAQVFFILNHRHFADAAQRRIVSGSSLGVGGGISRVNCR